jgi:hypothetical protein
MVFTKDNVVRFIALYEPGSPFVERIVLGHGYQGEGGFDHQRLARLFWGDGFALHNLYAGYLGIEYGVINVRQGGSGTLRIPADPVRSAELEKQLNTNEGVTRRVLSLFPLVVSNTVPYVLLPI